MYPSFAPREQSGSFQIALEVSMTILGFVSDFVAATQMVTFSLL